MRSLKMRCDTACYHMHETETTAPSSTHRGVRLRVLPRSLTVVLLPPHGLLPFGGLLSEEALIMIRGGDEGRVQIDPRDKQIVMRGHLRRPLNQSQPDPLLVHCLDLANVTATGGDIRRQRNGHPIPHADG